MNRSGFRILNTLIILKDKLIMKCYFDESEIEWLQWHVCYAEQHDHEICEVPAIRQISSTLAHKSLGHWLYHELQYKYPVYYVVQNLQKKYKVVGILGVGGIVRREICFHG